MHRLIGELFSCIFSWFALVIFILNFPFHLPLWSNGMALLLVLFLCLTAMSTTITIMLTIFEMILGKPKEPEKDPYIKNFKEEEK